MSLDTTGRGVAVSDFPDTSARTTVSAQGCPSLAGAIVRGWTYDGDTLTWSLLVPVGDGHVAMSVVYTGAFLMRGDGTVLDDVPLEQGRAYRIHGHRHEAAPVGAFHHLAFWPTPQFRIGFASVRCEQRDRSAA